MCAEQVPPLIPSIRGHIFPKEIWNVVWGYYHSYNVYELNQDFKASYKWDDLNNHGLWKNGRNINFFTLKSNIMSTTWKNCYCSYRCFSFKTGIAQNYWIPPRYFTTLIESDLSDSERARMLIKQA